MCRSHIAVAALLLTCGGLLIPVALCQSDKADVEEQESDDFLDGIDFENEDGLDFAAGSVLGLQRGYAVYRNGEVIKQNGQVPAAIPKPSDLEKAATQKPVELGKASSVYLDRLSKWKTPPRFAADVNVDSQSLGEKHLVVEPDGTISGKGATHGLQKTLSPPHSAKVDEEDRLIREEHLDEKGDEITPLRSAKDDDADSPSLGEHHLVVESDGTIKPVSNVRRAG